MNDESVIADLANIFLALSDKTRLRLIGAMASGEASVNYLAACVNESQPKVSRHLAYLRTMNVVTTRRNGKNVYYAIDTSSRTDAGNVLAAAVAALNGEAVSVPEYRSAVAKPATHEAGRDELAIYLL